MISNRFRNDKKPVLKLNKIQLKAKQEVEEKVSNKQYVFENCFCPICNSTESELISEKDRYGLEYRVVICKDCGLVYTNPRMTQESYNKFYDTEYRRLYIGTETATEDFFRKQYTHGKQIFNFIKSTFTDKKFANLNVLEVGCGAGGILQYFKEQGCNVLGVDLGNEYLEFGRVNYGLNLKHGTINEASNFKPDIVIYSHVIEHILDLNYELLLLKKLCPNNAIFYIEVPGLKNIDRNYKMDVLRYLQNAHTYHFSLLSLTNLFGKFGFSLKKGTNAVQSIFLFSQNENYKIINEYPEIYKYLKKMDQRRYLYHLNSNYKLIKKLVLKFLQKKSTNK
jgi:2-polyprenyl-3-methyl-5-hydroxy-6-metoxy-1,4-benzoquinol methylase